MPLRGKRVAVLESRLGRELTELVAGRGAEPFHAPAVLVLVGAGEVHVEDSARDPVATKQPCRVGQVHLPA